MVNLTRIYTRTGDEGQTRLLNNELTSKTDARLEAYGTCDEANCAIGLALTMNPDARLEEVLRHIQNELFDLGADLANPIALNPKVEPLRIISQSIEQLEAWCDEFGDQLPPLRSFVLPSGTALVAQLNVARTVVRRAERAAWRAAEQYGVSTSENIVEGGINELAIQYLNRLADLLFIAARYSIVLSNSPEVLWIPGGDRNPHRTK